MGKDRPQGFQFRGQLGKDPGEMPLPASDGAFFRPRGAFGLSFAIRLPRHGLFRQGLFHVEGVVMLVRKHPGWQVGKGPPASVQTAIAVHPKPPLPGLENYVAGPRSMPVDASSATRTTFGGWVCAFRYF